MKEKVYLDTCSATRSSLQTKLESHWPIIEWLDKKIYFYLCVYPPQYPYCSRHQGLRRKLSFTWPYLLTNWANQWSCVNICWITTKLSLQIQTLLHPLRREGGLLDTAGHQNKSFCLLCHYHPFTPGLGSKCVYWTSWFFKHFTGFKPKIVKVGCVLSCSSSQPIHYI